jgi:peptide/nickel transport system substrate-binding protein
LRIGLRAAPLSLDPHLHNDFPTYAVASNIYEGLMAFDRALGIRPALAETWTSPDDTTWRFHLRPGVVFHDGRPLTAADVVFSFERARQHPRSEYASYLISVRSVKATNPLTLEIVTETPNPLLLNRLAFVSIVPAGSPQEIEKPVGTGPYRLVSQEGARSIGMSAFDRYWGPKPAERDVRLLVVPGREESLRLLLGGGIDILPDLAAEDIDQVRAVAGLAVVSQPSPSVDVLGLNLHVAPFGSIRVRQAVSLALDRHALVELAFRGQARAASQLVSGDVFGFDAGLEPERSDVAAARRLLAGAGYPDGVDVTLEFREGERVDQVVHQLAQAGIRARAQPQPWGELLRRMASGEAPFSYSVLVADSGDAGDILDSTLHTRDPRRGFGDANVLGYSNPALDLLIESAGRASYLSQRQEILKSCMRLAMQDLPFVPILVRNDVYGLRAELLWEPRLDGRVLAYEVTRRPAGRRAAAAGP